MRSVSVPLPAGWAGAGAYLGVLCGFRLSSLRDFGGGKVSAGLRTPKRLRFRTWV